MSQRGAAPDAWDDDWESLADKPEAKPSQPTPAPKLSKSEKRAQHQQLQKEIWANAEDPSRKMWLEAREAVPLKQEPKSPMTVLTRKPVLARRNGAAGEDDEDSEEEARKKKDADFEERKRKAAVEREEKVRKYAEARERIMGSSNAVSSSVSPAPGSRESSQGRDNRKTRGKANGFANSRPTSAGQSPTRSTPVSKGEQLFDPEDMGRRTPRREGNAMPKETEPSRQPRGPDSSGRGGFGFGARGG